MRKPWNQASRIRSALRKTWQWSPMRQQALREAFVMVHDRLYYYMCDECCGLFPKKDVQVGHKVPVGTAPGTRNATASDTWDGFIQRMFCPAEELNVVCKPCHLEVTKREREERKNGI